MPLRPRHRAFVAMLITASVAVSTGLPPTGTASAASLPSAVQGVLGADISWPDCSPHVGRTGAAMPQSQARYVVLGLTNGPAFTRNPCLSAQVLWAQARSVRTSAYAVVSYPSRAQVRRYGGRGTLTQRVRRTGLAEARYSLQVLHAAGLHTPFVWVDVEHVGGFRWSTSTALNNALIDGVIAGYRAAHVRLGIYSYAGAWREITGGRRLTRVPTWVPSGLASVAAAQARCHTRSFSGGKTWLGQSTYRGRDIDVLCPGVPLTRISGLR